MAEKSFVKDEKKSSHYSQMLKWKRSKNVVSIFIASTTMSIRVKSINKKIFLSACNESKLSIYSSLIYRHFVVIKVSMEIERATDKTLNF